MIKKIITLGLIVSFTFSLFGCSAARPQVDGTIMDNNARDFHPRNGTRTGAVIGGSTGIVAGGIYGGVVGGVVGGILGGGLFEVSTTGIIVGALGGGIVGALIGGAAGAAIGAGTGYVVDEMTEGHQRHMINVQTPRRLVTT